MTETRLDNLRTWAAGSYPIEAATELLIRAFNGRFIQPGQPWIHTTGCDPWIEFADITQETTGVCSGGERRVLAIAAALGTHTQLDLVANITGLDHTHAHLVLAALAHAMGSHDTTTKLVSTSQTVASTSSRRPASAPDRNSPSPFNHNGHQAIASE